MMDSLKRQVKRMYKAGANHERIRLTYRQAVFKREEQRRRRLAKVASFGLAYGMGGKRFASQLRGMISREVPHRTVQAVTLKIDYSAIEARVAAAWENKK